VTSAANTALGVGILRVVRPLVLGDALLFSVERAVDVRFDPTGNGDEVARRGRGIYSLSACWSSQMSASALL